MEKSNKDKRTKIFLNLNFLACFILIEVLISNWLKFFPENNEKFLAIVAIGATLPVFFSAILSLKNRKISIDLLASIALTVALLEKERSEKRR